MRSEHLGVRGGEYTRGGLRAAFLRLAFFEPGGESNDFSQTILAAGFNACEGRALARPFKETRERLEELMILRGDRGEVGGEGGCW